MKTLIIVASLVIATLAYAGPATDSVRSTNTRIARLISKKVAAGSQQEKTRAKKIDIELERFLDVDGLATRAMRDHWSSLTKAKRQAFLALLRELIQANYVRGLRANLDYKVAYLSEADKGDHQLVTTEVQAMRRGRPYKISIDYRVQKTKKGWQTFDVITDGVGLVENYRAQFNKIIASYGFDGLMKRMKKKAAKLRELSK